MEEALPRSGRRLSMLVGGHGVVGFFGHEVVEGDVVVGEGELDHPAVAAGVVADELGGVFQRERGHPSFWRILSSTSSCSAAVRASWVARPFASVVCFAGRSLERRAARERDGGLDAGQGEGRMFVVGTVRKRGED